MTYYLLVLMVALIASSNNENVQSNSNKYCHYDINGITYKYTCAYNSTNAVAMKINVSNSLLGVQCFGLSKLDNTFFESLRSTPKLHYMYIRDCPNPEIGFANISKHFDMTQIKQMQFEERTDDRPLEAEFFVGMGTLQVLRLNKNNISIWRPDTLKYIPNIETLRLDDNRLILYDNMFLNASNLQFLSISHNHLTHLPKGVFKVLENLQGLHLTDNKIQEIHLDVLSELTKLANLNLSSNLLHHLDDGIFRNMHQLSWVSLSDNKFANISKELLRHCTPEYLEISNNPDLILAEGTFSNFFSLELLDLDSNGMTVLPPNLFSGSSSVKFISLRKNLLRFLPDDIFRDQFDVEELYLDFNKLETLSGNIFSTLKKLRILYLNDNSLTTMSDHLFRNCLNLRVLDLNHNRLLSFEPQNLSQNRSLDVYTKSVQLYLKLREVNLNHNKLTQYPRGSKVIADARNISLEYNFIQYFNTSFLRHLDVAKREINLEHNNITAINVQHPDEIVNTYGKTKLKIKISHNPIQCDCRALDLIGYLNWKSVNDSTGLQIIHENSKCFGPSSMKNIPLKNVVTTDLMCRLEEGCTEDVECYCYYKSVENILMINCSNKYLVEAPKLKVDTVSYGRVRGVELHLEENSIKEFPEIVGYEQVTKLYLQNNFISKLSWIPPSIQLMDLSNNKLESLDTEFLKKLDTMHIEELNLAKNPWSCACENIEFFHFLERNISNIIDNDNIKCNANGSTILDLKDEDLCPVKVHRGLTVLAFILFFSFILIINVLLFYIYRKIILTWLYAHGFCLWLVKEERIDKSKIYDAFVSYAKEDERFVVEQLLPNLEKGTPSFKLCLHTRNWIPGEYITTQINSSVRLSRRTLIVLSSNFLKSIWGKMEFRTAHTEASKEGRVRVIVIIYGDIDMKKMDDEWKSYMRTNTYIKWGDPWFWDKLRYALPRRHKS